MCCVTFVANDGDEEGKRGCFNGGKERGREIERGEHEIEGRKRERS